MCILNVLAHVLITCARILFKSMPPGRAPVSAATEYILNKADMEKGGPMGMLELVLYFDKHSVILL